MIGEWEDNARHRHRDYDRTAAPRDAATSVRHHKPSRDAHAAAAAVGAASATRATAEDVDVATAADRSDDVSDEDDSDAYDEAGQGWDDEVDDEEWDRLTRGGDPKVSRKKATAAAAASSPFATHKTPARSAGRSAAAASDSDADVVVGPASDSEADASDDEDNFGEMRTVRLTTHQDDGDADLKRQLLAEAATSSTAATADGTKPAAAVADLTASEVDAFDDDPALSAEKRWALLQRKRHMTSGRSKLPLGLAEDDPLNFPPIVTAFRKPPPRPAEAKTPSAAKQKLEAAQAAVEQRHAEAAATAEEEIASVLLKLPPKPRRQPASPAAKAGASGLTEVPRDVVVDAPSTARAGAPTEDPEWDRANAGTSFRDLGVGQRLYSKLHRFQWRDPTPIQQRAIPFVLHAHGHAPPTDPASTASAPDSAGRSKRKDKANAEDGNDETGESEGKDVKPKPLAHVRVPKGAYDVLIQDVTGSGKTLAYLLPLLTHIDNYTKALQAIILVPTRELAVQTERLVASLEATNSPLRKLNPLRIVRATGQVSLKMAEILYSTPPHVLIATPHSLQTLLCTKNLFNLSVLKYVVCDEIDALLADHSRPAVTAILDKIDKTARKDKAAVTLSAKAAWALDPPAARRNVPYSGVTTTKPGLVTPRFVWLSATITGRVTYFAKRYMHRPQHILPSAADPLQLSPTLSVANPFPQPPTAGDAASGVGAPDLSDAAAAAEADSDPNAFPLSDQSTKSAPPRVPGQVPHYAITAPSQTGKLHLLTKLWSSLKPTPRRVLVFVNDQRTAKPIADELLSKRFKVCVFLRVLLFFIDSVCGHVCTCKGWCFSQFVDERGAPRRLDGIESAISPLTVGHRNGPVRARARFARSIACLSL